jgi:predicted transcriptional regulator
MSNSNKETQRQSILHLWNIGVRDANEIHARTKISLSTIYYNLKKLKKTGTVECAHAKMLKNLEVAQHNLILN